MLFVLNNRVAVSNTGNSVIAEKITMASVSSPHFTRLTIWDSFGWLTIVCFIFPELVRSHDHTHQQELHFHEGRAPFYPLLSAKVWFLLLLESELSVHTLS